MNGFIHEVVMIANRAATVPEAKTLGNGAELPSRLVEALEVIAIERRRANNALEVGSLSPGRGSQDES